MTLLTGLTDGGVEVPVQVDAGGRLVAEGLPGPAGPAGPTGDPGPQGIPGAAGSTGATGAQGPTGATGPAGADGADGAGVPAGGSTGQVLTKSNSTDYVTEWASPAAGNGFTYAYKTVSTDKASDAELAADPHLFLPLSANKIYAFKAHLYYFANATPDIKATIIGPTLANGSQFQCSHYAIVPGSSSFGSIGVHEGYLTAGKAFLSGTTGRGQIFFSGRISTDDASGDMAVHWAQNTSSTVEVQVSSGSYIAIMEIS
jgi:hypothetical protein